MNRGDFILDTIKKGLSEDESFSVVNVFTEKLVSGKVRLYPYILDEVQLPGIIMEDDTYEESHIFRSNIGIKIAWTNQEDTEDRGINALEYNDIVAKIEYALRQIELPVETEDSFYATKSAINSISIQQSFGFFDDRSKYNEGGSVIVNVFTKHLW